MVLLLALRWAPNGLFWLYLKQTSQSSRDCLLSLSFSISKDWPVVLRHSRETDHWQFSVRVVPLTTVILNLHSTHCVIPLEDSRGAES